MARLTTTVNDLGRSHATAKNSSSQEKERTFSYPALVVALGLTLVVMSFLPLGTLAAGHLWTDEDASRYDRRILIERGLNAREIEVSVIGNEVCRASTPGEIKPSDEFYSYNAKYVDGDSELFIPAPLPEELTERIREMAVKTYQSIDCAGLARVDFLLDKDTNELFLNEVNTIPGFTSISMYPKLWEADGLSYVNLIDELIDLAFKRKLERNKSKRTFGD